MKKLLSLILIVFAGVGLIRAAPVGKTAAKPFEDTTLLGVNQEDIYVATVSTQVAKNVLNSNESRKAYTINNLDGGNSVYKATYSATSSELDSYKNYSSTTPSAGFIEIGSSYSDSSEPYTGDIYIIGDSTTTQIEIMERY